MLTMKSDTSSHDIQRITGQLFRKCQEDFFDYFSNFCVRFQIILDPPELDVELISSIISGKMPNEECFEESQTPESGFEINNKPIEKYREVDEEGDTLSLFS